MKRINLLPPGEREKASRQQGMTYALLGLVALVLALGAIYLVFNREVATKQDQVSELQAQVGQVNQQVASLQWAAKLQSQRVAMMTAAKQIYDARVDWSTIAEEVSLLVPDNVWLTELSAQVPATMLAGSAIGQTGAGGSSGTDVTFTGSALSMKDVAVFMTRLGLMPQLESPTLVNASEATSGTSTSTTASGTSSTAGTSVVNFQITAALRPFLVHPPYAVTATTTTAGGAQ
jgi:type IV pilus assembly protein PilN